MAKKKGRNQKEDSGPAHRPRKERAHISQEYQDLNNIETRDEMLRGLLPWAQEALLHKRVGKIKVR